MILNKNVRESQRLPSSVSDTLLMKSADVKLSLELVPAESPELSMGIRLHAKREVGTDSPALTDEVQLMVF
jgi:hypothetical protein